MASADSAFSAGRRAGGLLRFNAAQCASSRGFGALGGAMTGAAQDGTRRNVSG